MFGLFDGVKLRTTESKKSERELRVVPRRNNNVTLGKKKLLPETAPMKFLRTFSSDSSKIHKCREEGEEEGMNEVKGEVILLLFRVQCLGKIP